MRTTLWALVLCILSACSSHTPTAAYVNGLSLTLIEAVVQRWHSEPEMVTAPDEFGVTFTLVTDNRTPAPLVVDTEYATAYAGLHLVLLTQNGSMVAQIPYLTGRSPVGSPNTNTIVMGRATNSLGIGIAQDRVELRKILTARTPLRAQVIAEFPGSEYRIPVTSNLADIKYVTHTSRR